jgi:hypothetical protein
MPSGPPSLGVLVEAAGIEMRTLVAIFYKDARYAKGLIPLGRIDFGIDALTVPGPLKVTIEPVEK